MRAADFAQQAQVMKARLVEKVMPYWCDTAIDRTNGGYLLADDRKGRSVATEKQVVTQSRMIWTFSHTHRKGLIGDGKRNYLRAAQTGYRFLIDHFLDPQHGGYFWKTDLEGKPVHDCKFLYGEAFVVYALVEYYRASGDTEVLRRAVDLYRTLEAKLHDRQHGGWLEHTTRDWQPLEPNDSRNQVEVVGLKSANAHLHWMEALAELYAVTSDSEVKDSLKEALRINATYFYPKDAGKSAFHRQPDWSPVTDPRSAGLSYGHNVEFAWLMIRAQEVLRDRRSWAHFDGILAHALKYGYDHERGGLYNRGEDDLPATQTDKVWWVQAEMLAALTDGLKQGRNATYAGPLDKLLRFIWNYQADPTDWIWLDTVTFDGKPKSTAKAHSWKANYHDVRAMVKFIEAFSPESL
jgi:mannobiose 2-epimerase